MKVLQLISSAGPYGAENMAISLARELHRRGCDSRLMFIANRHRPDPHVREFAARRGAIVETLACAGRFDRGAILRLRAYLRQEKIDVLHAHGYKARLFGWLAARGTGAARITTCHGWIRSTVSLKAYALLDSLVLRRYPVVVAVSERVRFQLRRHLVPASALVVIDNGVDVEEFEHVTPSLRAPGETDLLIGAVGRLSPEKGLGDLLQAFAVVLRSFPQAALVLVGDGPEREKLERLARNLGIAARVRFAGRRDDMPAVYASLDLLAMPSLQEGLPMTLLEAMASSLPVVATTVGAMPKVIAAGENGMLVPPGDAASLRAAIERLLADADLRQRLGAAARVTIARRFSSARTCSEYLSRYESLRGGGFRERLAIRREVL